MFEQTITVLVINRHYISRIYYDIHKDVKNNSSLLYGVCRVLSIGSINVDFLEPV